MKRVLFGIISLVFIMMLSCTSAGQRNYEKLQKEAHDRGCMTEKEFLDLKNTYAYEQKLPCLVYVDRLCYKDISSKLNRYAADSIYWVGNPSDRRNQAWLTNIYPSYYIGLTKEQADYITQHYGNHNVKTPVILKVYQVDGESMASLQSFMADMVEIVGMIK